MENTYEVEVKILEVLLEVVGLVVVLTESADLLVVEVGVVIVLLLVGVIEVAFVVGAKVAAVFWKHLQADVTLTGGIWANWLGRATFGDARYFGQKAAETELNRSRARRALSSKQTSARLALRG